MRDLEISRSERGLFDVNETEKKYKLDRRQAIGIFISCVPLVAYGKPAVFSEKQTEPPDSSLMSSAQFYLLSGWVLAESDLEFFSGGELVNAKRLQ